MVGAGMLSVSVLHGLGQWFSMASAIRLVRNHLQILSQMPSSFSVFAIGIVN